MKIKRAFTAGLLAAATLSAATVAGAAPAQADVYGCATSRVCLFDEAYRQGIMVPVSGYDSYEDMGAHGWLDRTSSWTNACNYQRYVIGEWVSNGQSRMYAQYLPAGWYENSLASVYFDNRADFVQWA